MQRAEMASALWHKELRGLAAAPGVSSRITHKRTHRHSVSLSDLPLTQQQNSINSN